MMRNPVLFVAQDGTGRIRVYGVPDYEFADVTVDQGGKLSCSLVKLAAAESAANRPVPPNQQQVDLDIWYEKHGCQTLETLVADLESRGHHALTVQEDGSVCISPQRGRCESEAGPTGRIPCQGVLAPAVSAPGAGRTGGRSAGKLHRRGVVRESEVST